MVNKFATYIVVYVSKMYFSIFHLSLVLDAEVAKRMGTPPLPVMSDGDVPEATCSARKIVYNDEQYQVKLARPALVKDEPVYANNKPEHYAVSTKYPGKYFMNSNTN